MTYMYVYTIYLELGRGLVFAPPCTQHTTPRLYRASLYRDLRPLPAKRTKYRPINCIKSAQMMCFALQVRRAVYSHYTCAAQILKYAKN